MREFAIVTPVRGQTRRVWETLTDISRYGEWCSLIPSAEGEAVAGEHLELRLLGPGGMVRPFRPTVVAVDPPRELVLEASVGHRSLIHMVHYFRLSGCQPALQLEQRWEATGALVPVLWPLLRRGMARFERFGEDLDRRLAGQTDTG